MQIKRVIMQFQSIKIENNPGIAVTNEIRILIYITY